MSSKKRLASKLPLNFTQRIRKNQRVYDIKFRNLRLNGTSSPSSTCFSKRKLRTPTESSLRTQWRPQSTATADTIAQRSTLRLYIQGTYRNKIAKKPNSCQHNAKAHLVQERNQGEGSDHFAHSASTWECSLSSEILRFISAAPETSCESQMCLSMTAALSNESGVWGLLQKSKGGARYRPMDTPGSICTEAIGRYASSMRQSKEARGLGSGPKASCPIGLKDKLLT